MAIRKVAQLGNPVLRRKAEPVPVEMIQSQQIQTLIDDMIETSDEYSGAGLAAPQVHESVQIIVAGLKEDPRYEDEEDMPLVVLINPKIAAFSTEMDEDWEGCLSLGDLWGRVKRALSITVTGFGRDGKQIEFRAEGFKARVFQHEIDHLHGKVFIDRMSNLDSLCFARERIRFASLYEKVH